MTVSKIYDAICEWLSIHPVSTGGLLAIILTALRIAMAENNKSFAFVCVEGLCCGLLSMAFSYSAIGMLGVDSSVAVLIGGSAGFIGLDRLKVAFIKVFDAWVSSHSNSNDGKKEE